MLLDRATIVNALGRVDAQLAARGTCAQPDDDLRTASLPAGRP
jgi:hypothetical protein